MAWKKKQEELDSARLGRGLGRQGDKWILGLSAN